MGTSHLNILLRDHTCTPITDCWLLDLVVQFCSGKPLYEVFPLLPQLKTRYSKPAKMVDLSEYPLADQAGSTLIISVNGGANQTLTFTTPAITPTEIYEQVKTFFTGVIVTLENNRICITTEEFGPDASLSIDPASTCDLLFGPIQQGSGYKIGTRYYHGASRIKIQPPLGEYINHVEIDVPTGCYKIWGRVCHGRNEETSHVMIPIENCGECYTVDLLLAEVMSCGRDFIYPFIDRVANDFGQILPEKPDRVNVLKAIAHTASLSRAQILEELIDRKQDALDINRGDIADRVDEMASLATDLPQCY
jgi:hypothetical protein